MTAADLRASTSLPPGLSSLLRALWHEAHGDWHLAHSLVQDLEGPEAARVHAYLHRAEGDEFNAGYWYRRAGRAPFTGSLEEEWAELAALFL